MQGKKELFIVEGKSAASTVRQAIDKKTQSVHAIQGKLINVSKASDAVVDANLECQGLLSALGCGKSPDCVPEKLNFSSVIILMDPDIDGEHSTALLLSFFARYCEPLVTAGLLYMIKPPKFRITHSEKDSLYAWSEKELRQLLDDGSAVEHAIQTRFKGVAQFSVEECHQLLLCPETRRQFVIKLTAR